MEPIYPVIAVGSLRVRVVGRTPDELRMMVNILKDEPEVWHVYSIHMNMASAHTRASQLRKGDTPKSLLDAIENLEFKAIRHVVHGPCVLVRWRITEGTTTVSP